MNKVLFNIKGYPLKVRDVVIAVIIIVVLLLGLRGCSSNGDKKDIAINNTCEFTRRNIGDLNDLLERADLCSKDWFKDLDEYLVRLEEQNDLLKNKKDSENINIYKLQKEILKDLVAFKDKQDEETISKLQETIKKYRDNYDLIPKCKGGNA